MLDRAQGCLLGQLAGDALGSLVEFQKPEDILRQYPNGVRELAESLEHGVIDTVMRGGDSDTNAAIAGALLGAVWGRSAIPAQWEDSILNCRPKVGEPNVRRPRPERFWPVDALALAEALVGFD